jgi:rhamnogalacturonan endolyase
VQTYAQQPIPFTKKKLIFKDSFSKKIDSNTWRKEVNPNEDNRVFSSKGKLWLDTRDGVTVWYAKPLAGNYCIEYKRNVVLDSGANDRLSDVNNFWQASDSNNPNLFTRNGVFESYDDLQLYYAGIGGNNNSTSRFRKYHGNKEKPVISEYTDSAHLLKANHTYHIRIVYLNRTTQLFVDSKLWFSYSDPDPLPAGYFGLRSTKSRQWVDEVRIWEIE